MCPIRCRCGTMRQTYQDPRCRWCGERRRGLEHPWGNVAIPEIMRGLAAVPVGGGRAWPGFETTRRAKLAARTASGRATARRHAKQPGPTVRCDGARSASGAASNTAGAAARWRAKQPGPTARPHSPAPRQGATVPGVPVEPYTTVGNQPEYPASSVARWTPPRPVSWAAWVRHEKPSARYTASG